MKLMTAPFEKPLFLIATFGVIAASMALFLTPSGCAQAGSQDAPAASQATGAASRPSSRPASRPAGQPETMDAVDRADVKAGLPSGTLLPDEFPLEVYARLLDAHLKDGLVDYHGLFSTGRKDLGVLVTAIAMTDLGSLRRLRDKDLIAWYANAYNILTLDTIVKHYPVESIMKLDKPWDTPLDVAGERLTLNQIEHDVLRLRDADPAARAAFVDPRIHFVLNCASIGCPVLYPEPLTAANLDEAMEASARAFISDPAKFSFEEGTWRVSQLLDWYGDDFRIVESPELKALSAKLAAAGVAAPEKAAAIALFFAPRLPDRRVARALEEGAFTLEWQEYDWAINAQR